MIQEGTVTRVDPGRVEVDLGARVVTASLRGQLKSGPRHQTNVVVVGDRVRVFLGEDKGTRLEEILRRRNHISRVDPGNRQQKVEQVLAANLDWLAVVVSIRDPALNPRALDRLLVVGECAGLNCLIVLNKIDLAEEGRTDLVDPYEQIGYPVHRTSVRTGQGCEELRQRLTGRVSYFLGPSGVGKSSLLNRMFSGLELRTTPVSAATSKGVHTTTRVDWIPLPEGGAILDSPGIRSIQPWGLERSTLAQYFPEFRTLPPCQFRDCLHLGEPACQVRLAAEERRISESRYDSYRRILATLGPTGGGRHSWTAEG